MILRPASGVARAVALALMLLATIQPSWHAAAQTPATRTASPSVPAAKGELLRSVPDIVTDSLPNGVRILFARVNDLPLAEINVIVDAGMSCETADEYGTAWTLVQLLTGGNSERTAEMVSSYLAEMGSTVVPYAHYDYAQLYGRTLSRNFSGTLEVMADGIISPRLREQELAAIQRTSSTRLQRVASSGERATVAAVRSLCGDGHVLTRYLLPRPEDVAAVTRERLTAFHQRWYRPSRTTVIVTGDLDYRFVRTAIIEAFGGWQDGERAPMLRATIDADVAGGGGDLVRLLPEDETPNGLAYFRLGVRAPLRGEDAFVATVLLNSMLSDGAQSRLRRMFWQQHTISPNFTAALAFSRDCSYFMISGSASPLMADSVFAFAQETVRDIAERGVSEEELEMAKSMLLSNEALAFATNRSVQSLLKESVVYRIPLPRLLSFTERLRGVTVEEVRMVASALFQTERWTQVVLGNAGRLEPVIEASGRTVLRIERTQDDEPRTKETEQGTGPEETPEDDDSAGRVE